MKNGDDMHLEGRYEIELRDAASGRLIKRLRLKNQLTTINQAVRAQMLMGTFTGDTDALQIAYIAVGTGTAAASASDTALGNETFRKAITQQTLASAGVVRTIVSLGQSEANGTIKEIGVFCGANANGNANTGTLLSRINVNITKNSNMVLNIIRTDICTI